MYGGRGRVGAAVAVLIVAFSGSACGAEVSTDDAPSTPATSQSPDDEAMQAAEATVRAFFAVKGRATDPISVLIDEQAVYLTRRDVHPTAAYEAGLDGRASLITDKAVHVELSNARWSGDEIRMDFAFTHSGVSYPMRGTEIQFDAGLHAEGHWDGTATLENRDGAWLINDLTIVRHGGTIS